MIIIFVVVFDFMRFVYPPDIFLVNIIK